MTSAPVPEGWSKMRWIMPAPVSLHAPLPAIMAAAPGVSLHRAAELAIVAATTAGIYLFLVVLLRVFGRRQLGQLTVVDLLVVLLLGSTVETSMIHGDVSLAAGLGSAGTLLVHEGVPVPGHLRRAGMSAQDLLEALRDRGYEGLSGVREAVLETDGSVS